MWELNKKTAKSRINPKSIITCNLYNRVKANARQRSREFSLSKDEFYKLATSNCFYCGSSPNLKCYPTVKVGGRKGKAAINYERFHLYNGIDRKDSTKGYIPENVVTCCRICNIAKSNMPLDAFLEWIERVYIHNYGGSGSGIQWVQSLPPPYSP